MDLGQNLLFREPPRSVTVRIRPDACVCDLVLRTLPTCTTLLPDLLPARLVSRRERYSPNWPSFRGRPVFCLESQELFCQYSSFVEIVLYCLFNQLGALTFLFLGFAHVELVIEDLCADIDVEADALFCTVQACPILQV